MCRAHHLKGGRSRKVVSYCFSMPARYASASFSSRTISCSTTSPQPGHPAGCKGLRNSTPLPNDHWRNRLSTKIAITRVPANGSGVPSRGVYPGRAPSPAAEQLDGHLERHHSGTARTREGGDGATCSSPLMSRDNSFFSSVKPLPKLVKSCSTSFSACTVPHHTLSQSLAALSAHPRR